MDIPATGHAGLTESRSPTLDTWELITYIARPTPRSIAAIANVRKICEQHMPGHYRLKVIDLMQNPEPARTDQILAIPTLVKPTPAPPRRIIGDLSLFQPPFHRSGAIAPGEYDRQFIVRVRGPGRPPPS